MTIKKLCSAIALKEGKKSVVKIGDVREIVAILSDMVIKEPIVIMLLIQNGLKRKKKK